MSLNIATTGLNAITEQLNSISHNIANAATVGYKSETAEFASMYSQSKPMGVAVSGVSRSIGRQGALNSTGNSLDLAINGRGFFVLRDGAGDTVYTRAGTFKPDESGTLINNLGMKVQGYAVDANGVLQKGIIGDLKINAGAMAAKATDKLDFTANLDAGSPTPTVNVFDPGNPNSYNFMDSVKVFDSLGGQHTFSQYFIKTAANTWTVRYQVNVNNVAAPVDAGTQNLTFDANGNLTAPAGGVVAPTAVPIPGANALNIGIQYNNLTQYGSASAISSKKQNGHTSGTQTGQKIEDNGEIYATFSNGERMLQGQLVLASFSNDTGLAPLNGTIWSPTRISGEPVISTPGSGLVAKVEAGKSEGSNVDLTGELVGLMTAQRNYQANTKVISTNSTMMNALMQVL